MTTVMYWVYNPKSIFPVTLFFLNRESWNGTEPDSSRAKQNFSSFSFNEPYQTWVIFFLIKEASKDQIKCLLVDNKKKTVTEYDVDALINEQPRSKARLKGAFYAFFVFVFWSFSFTFEV